jgi:hypothetical protein
MRKKKITISGTWRLRRVRFRRRKRRRGRTRITRRRKRRRRREKRKRKRRRLRRSGRRWTRGGRRVKMQKRRMDGNDNNNVTGKLIYGRGTRSHPWAACRVVSTHCHLCAPASCCLCSFVALRLRIGVPRTATVGRGGGGEVQRICTHTMHGQMVQIWSPLSPHQSTQASSDWL